MSVEFEEQNIARQLQYTTFGEKPKGISGKLISWGVAKDEKSANKVLMGIFITLLIVIILFLSFSFNNGDLPAPEFQPPAY